MAWPEDNQSCPNYSINSSTMQPTTQRGALSAQPRPRPITSNRACRRHRSLSLLECSNRKRERSRSTQELSEDLQNDTENRWTGTAEAGSGGSGGLYMSLEAEKGLDTEFPELNHYQGNDEHGHNTDIEFYDFKDKRAVRANAKHFITCSRSFLRQSL